MTRTTAPSADPAADVLRSFRELKVDYAPDRSVFNEEPDRLRRVKEIIDGLPQVDRVIFLSYVDCGSLRALASKIGVSYATLQKEISRIRKDILKQYDPNL